MRNLKRALSLALASVMLLGMMVVGTSASYADVDSTKNVEAIEVLQAVGVMSGDDKGNFNPDQKVTRGEMAVVMANLLNLQVKDFIGAKTPFTDVPEWAVPYVAACYADGITAGISATEYGFNYEVTTAQAALMMMKALGYFQLMKDFGNDWQVATVKQGSKINLFDGITAGASTAMTRNEVAQIALNTLKATMVETDGTNTIITLPGGITVDSGDTKYVDVTNTSSKYAAIDNAKDGDKYYVQLGEKLFDGNLKLTKNVPDDFNRPGVKWTYNSKAVGTYADKADYVYTSEVKSKDIYSDLGLSKTISATVSEDGDPKASFSVAKNSSTKIGGNGVRTEVYYDSDKETVEICKINTYVGEIASVYPDADEPYSVITGITGNGGQFETTAFDEEAIVLYTYADGEIQSVALAEKVGGVEVTSFTTSGSKYTALKAGGTSYDVAQGYALDSKVGSSLTKETSYDLYLDANGYVIYVGYYEAASNNYAYVLDAKQIVGDWGTDKYFSAKLLLADGSVVTVKTDEEKTAPAGWVTYTVDDNNVYSLVSKDTVSQLNSHNICNIILTNGTSQFEVKTSSVHNDKATYYANNNTVFVVYDKAEDEYTSYTGINAVPSIKNGNSYAGAESVAIYADKTMAKYVYIELANSNNVSGSTSDVIYIVAASKSDKISDELGEYYEYTALVNGEITTLKIKSDVTFTGDQVIKGVTTNNKGLVTALGGTVTGLQTQATGTKKASAGTVGLGTKYYAYADDVNVYKIDDKVMTKATINAIKDDTNDTVYFVLDEGVVTDIFFTVVDGANQAGQLNNVLNKAIAEATFTEGKGLVSIEMSGNTITVKADKDIKDSGIVNSISTALKDVVGEISNIKVGELYNGSDLAQAAAALKKDINDNKIPDATDKVQEGSAKYTITLTMKDNSTVIYNVVVEWSVPATPAP